MERTDGRRHHAMTIARWPSASGAKNQGLFRKVLIGGKNQKRTLVPCYAIMAVPDDKF